VLDAWLGFLLVLAGTVVIYRMHVSDVVALSRSMILSCVVAVFIFTVASFQQDILLVTRRYSFDADTNPNRLAMFFVCTSAIMASFIFTSGLRLRGGISVAAGFLLCVLFVLLSGSRSALFAMLLAPIIWWAAVSKRVNFSFYAYIALIGIGVYWAIAFAFENFEFLERFRLENIMMGGGDTRLETLNLLVPLGLREAPLLGFGFGGQTIYALAYKHGAMYSAHNLVFDVFLQMGLIGVLIFASLLVTVARVSLANSASYSVIGVGAIPLIAMCIHGIAETIFLERHFWILMGMIIMHARSIDQR
jgi:O-antigen ligase